MLLIRQKISPLFHRLYILQGVSERAHSFMPSSLKSRTQLPSAVVAAAVTLLPLPLQDAYYGPTYTRVELLSSVFSKPHIAAIRSGSLSALNYAIAVVSNVPCV